MSLTGATVAARYRSGRNSLNLLRLVLAALVIVSHAWPIGGYGDDPNLLGVPLGFWAVAGFFGISGYLIAVSRERHGPVPFLVRRVLRIYPGFWVVLLLTAFVFAPIAAAAGSGSWSVPDALHYLRYTFTLQMHTYSVGSTLHDAPYPSAWDGALWTLRWEFLCYLLIGVLLTVRRLRQPLVWLAFLVAAAHSWWRGDDPSNFAALFLAGSVIAVNRHRLPLVWWLALPAAGLAVVGALTDHLAALGGLGVAYTLLYLGVVLPLRGFGQKHDLSYGMYIYGFPVAQLLVLAGVAHLPVGVAVLVELAATVPLAALSWWLVERPAQRLAPRFDAMAQAIWRVLVHRGRPPAPPVTSEPVAQASL